MKMKKILGLVTITIPLMLVGCSVESNNVESVSDTNTMKEEHKLLEVITGKEIYKDIKIKIPHTLEEVEVDEDMLLYKIDNSKRSISVGCDYIGEQELSEYMSKVKNTLGDVIDLSESKEDEYEVGQLKLNTLEYKYLIEEKESYIYQACFKNEELAYVLTLWSDKENIDSDKVILEKMISGILV